MTAIHIWMMPELLLRLTTKSKDKGPGVGLFMAKSIVEKNMGGRLSVRNTGNGAEFLIEMDLCRSAPI